MADQFDPNAYLEEEETIETGAAGEPTTFDPDAFIEEESEREFDAIETSATEAFVRGTADELSFGLADEAEAIVDTIAQGLSGDLEDIPLGEAYEQNVDAARKEYKKARETHGIAYGAGQATGIAASLVTGAGVGKLAAKGTGVLAKSAAKLLSGGAVKAAAKVGAVQGAVQGFGRGEGTGESIKDALVGAATGGVLGGGLAKGFEKAGKALASESALRNKVFNAFGIRTMKIRRQVDRTLKSQKKDMASWVAELADETVVTPDVSGTGFKRTADKLMKFTDSQDDIILKAQNNIGIYEEAREELLSKLPIKNPSSVIGKLDDAIDNVFTGGALGEMEQKAVAAIKKDVRTRMQNAISQTAKDGVSVVPAQTNLLELYHLRRGIDETLSSKAFETLSPRAADQLSKAVRTRANSLIDEAVDASGLVAKDLLSDKATRTKLQSLYTLKDALSEDIVNKSSQWAPFADIMIASATSNVAGSSKGLFAGVLALKTISRSPRVNREMAIRLAKTAQIVESKGFAGEKVARRLLISAEAGPEIFGKAIESVLGEEALAQDVVQRTSEDVLNKSQAILSIAEYHTPALASQLRDALEDEDYETIAPIMDQLSKAPATKKFFKPGVGFDGKVYDPEDKAKMVKELDNMDISHRQRLELKRNLLKDNVIPQVQQEEDPFLQYKARNKNTPDY